MKSLQTLIIEAQAGNSESQFELGRYYLIDSETTVIDINQGLIWYQMSSENDHPLATYNLGTLYLEGKLVNKDIKKALSYFEKGAKLNHSGSAYKAGFLLEKIMTVVDDESQQIAFSQKVIMYYKLAASLGSVEAMKALHRFGEFVIDKQARPQFIPLSFAQQRLWFIDRLLPNSPIYNLSLVTKFQGILNLTAFEQAFKALIERHEILRTEFVDEKGVVEQKIETVDACELTISQINLEHLLANEREEKAIKLCEELLLKPFDLSKAPLFYIYVIKLNETEHILLLSMHHIISDGWSLSILAKEVSLFYNHYAYGHSLNLKPLFLQYADFALWQRDWLKDKVLEQQLSYWRNQLQGIPEALDFPTDKKRPQILSYQGAVCRFEIDSKVSCQLHDLAEKEQASLYMVLLGGLYSLLYRYTQQETLVIGSLIANRHYQEIEELIGFFVNTLALRADINGELSFIEVLRQVREITLDAYAHQDLPFEQLVDHLQVARNINCHPLFQIVLVLQNNRPINYDLEGIKAESVRVNYPIAKFDLAIVFIEEEEKLGFEIEYATDLFEKETIIRLGNHFKELLCGIARRPNYKIAELPLLTGEEKQNLITNWSRSLVKYPEDKTIHQLFEEQANRTPDNIAVRLERSELTYLALNERANQIAHELHVLGLQPENLVAVSLPRSLDLIVAVLGILKAGGAYVPLDLSYPDERLQFMLKDSGAKYLLTYKAELNRYINYEGCLFFIDDMFNIPFCRKSNPISSVKPHHLAYVIYTSGSTGLPKGVMIEHRQVVRLFKTTENHFRFNEQDIWTLFHSYSFDFAVWELWGALLHGGTLIIVPEKTARDPELFYQLLIEEQVTVLNQTPSAFYALQDCDTLQDVERTKLCLRWVIFGGEAFNIQRIKDWINHHGLQCPSLVNMYGITETTVHVTLQPINTAEKNGIGEPLNDLSLYILDEYLEPVSIGSIGELYVRGAGLARGYLHRPDLTAKQFIANPFDREKMNVGTRLYRTGDLVRRLSNGNLEYIGRQDNQIKIRGYRIELGEIENVIRSFDKIKDTAVLFQNIGEVKQLVAYLIFNIERKKSLEEQVLIELKQHIQTYLPSFMLPVHYVVISEFPLTTNGKLDKRRLIFSMHKPVNSTKFELPNTLAERILAQIWSQVLGVKNIGLYDNYFDLGGDSIRSIRIVALSRQAGLIFSVADIFRYPNLSTLASKAQLCNSNQFESEKPFALIEEQDREFLPASILDAYPLTSLQAGMLFHSQYSPERAIYQDTFSYEITGSQWNESNFRLALTCLLNRHPVLRTSFVLDEYSKPLQYVHKDVVPLLEVVDLCEKNQEAQDEYISKWLEAEKQRRLNLDQAPLIRFSIHIRSEEEFHLGFSMHHAILDGWSVASMLMELLENYDELLSEGLVRGRQQLALGFNDYVALEIKVRQDNDQRDFWKKYLKDANYLQLPKLITLGSIRDRSTSALYRMELNRELVQSLHYLSTKFQVSIKTLFLSIHCRVLSVLGSQYDIVTGYTLNGRLEEKDGDKVFGLFLNTIPLRINTLCNSWEELIRCVYKTEQDILAHRRFPLSEIQKLKDGKELFEVAFNYINFHIYKDLGHIKISKESVYEETNFAFGVSIHTMSDSRYCLQIGYDPNLFSANQISQYANCYLHSIEQLLDNPKNNYNYQCILSTNEKDQILKKWNETQTHYQKEKTIIQLFEEQVVRTPDSIAIVFDNKAITYLELNQKANQLSCYIRRHCSELSRNKVQTFTLIGLCVERSIEMIIGILGILKVGCAYVPLDPGYPEERLQFMIEDTDIQMLLAQSCTIAKFKSFFNDKINCKIVNLDQIQSDIQNYDTFNVSISNKPDNILYVIYTSGSTGKPKGVMVSHQNLVNTIQARNNAYKEELKSLLLLQSISVDTANASIFWTLLKGGSLVIPKSDEILDFVILSKLINLNKVSHILCTPSLYQELLEYKSIEEFQFSDITSLQIVILGGEILANSLVSKHKEKLPRTWLYNEWGLTEGSVWSSFAIAYNAEKKEAEEIISIGKPASNTQLYILDDNLLPVPLGVTGELYIGGAGIAVGYLNRPDLTSERFIANPFLNNELEPEIYTRIYKTGDLARYLQDGNIDYIGRIDNQVKIRGFRIELGEIETILKEHPDVKDAAVIAREEESLRKQLIAYVVSETGVADGEPAGRLCIDLQTYLEKKLPDHMRPNHIMFISSMPLNINGKVDTKMLINSSQYYRAVQGLYVKPRNETEKKLINIWSELLRIEPTKISVFDNFFKLGGDSIVSIQLVAHARKQGIVLSVKHIFEYPTIAQLKEIADSTKALVKINQLSVRGEIPLLPIQRWFFELQLTNIHHFNQAFLLKCVKTLDCENVNKAFRAIFKHHDILRSKFYFNQQWLQIIEPDTNLDKEICFEIDISNYESGSQSQILLQNCQQLQSSLNITEGPLMKAVLFNLGIDEPQRLFIVIHHLVIDGVSWRILLEDFVTAYDQCIQGSAIHLPQKTNSYLDWSLALQNFKSSTLAYSQLDYWLKYETRIKEFCLPVDFSHTDQVIQVDSLRTCLDEANTFALLHQVPQAYNTQINDILITALTKVFADWTSVSGIYFNLEGHGREEAAIDLSLDLSRTLGWFTSMFPIYLYWNEEELSCSIKSIKEQLRQIPERGIGYGILRYLSPDDERIALLMSLPTPQISFNYLGQFDNSLNANYFSMAPETVVNAVAKENQINLLFNINSFIINGQLTIDWVYSSRHYKKETIENLSKCLIQNLIKIIKHCSIGKCLGYTPSDFPLACLTQSELDNIIGPEDLIEDVYPLSPMQTGLLFRHLFSPASDDYFVQLIIKISGNLNRDLFRRAWETVINHHAVLRTKFITNGLTKPLQFVYKNIVLPWEEYDWRGINASAQKIEMDSLIQAQRQKHFILHELPLLRLQLIQLENNRYYLLLNKHHIVSDGWSLPILLKSVFSNYELLTGKGHVQLPENPNYQYRNFIAWLIQQDISKAEVFWKDYLHGFIEPTLMANTGLVQFKKQQSSSIQDECFELSEMETTKLKYLAQQFELTLNTILQGALSILISHYTQQQDIIFGVTLSGRSNGVPHQDQMIGLFINTLPLRIKIDYSWSLLMFLRNIQKLMLQLDLYSYISLANIQSWSELGSGITLFDTLFVFENYPLDNAYFQSLSDLNVKMVKSVEKVEYPLAIFVIANEKLHCQFSYQTQYFNNNYIKNLCFGLKNILLEIISNPEQNLDEISPLTKKDKHKILNDWSRVITSVYPKEKPLNQLFEEQVARTPNATAVIFDSKQLTYEELNAKSNQLAHYLQEIGIKQETFVAISIERSLELIIGLLGILKAGGAYVPLDPNYPSDRLDYMLEDTQAFVLLTEKDLVPQFSHYSGRIICLDSDWKKLIEIKSTENLKVLISPQQAAYVIYTSGSTGKPKGVIVEHAGVVNRLLWGQAEYNLSERDRLLQKTPFSFDVSVWEFFWPLIVGAQLVIAKPGIHHDPSSLEAAIVEYQISVLHFVPSMLMHFLALKMQDLPSLRLLFTSGEALAYKIMKDCIEKLPNVNLHNLYGPTEAAIEVSHWKCKLDSKEEKVLIGKPIANIQLYVLDKNGRVVSPGVTGELYIGGIGVARGYLNRSDMTAERFVANPFATDTEIKKGRGTRLYRTGDLVRYLENGDIEYLGRTDSQIKLRGFRIELGEIESVIRTHADVKDVVVIIDGDPFLQKELITYFVLKNSKLKRSRITKLINELRQLLSKQLPNYMMPTHFVLLKNIPLGPSGKINKKSLPKPKQSSLLNEYVAPRNEIEENLCEIWQQTLDVQRVGIHDNFFSLGGDSIKIIQIVSKARSYQLYFTVKEVFEYPTIAGLSLHVNKAYKIIGEQGLLEGDCGLLPIQQWFFELELSNKNHFNQSQLIIVSEKLDKKRLLQAVQKLIVHHDALRLRFSQSAQGWKQYYSKDIPLIDIYETDISLSHNVFQEILDVGTRWQSDFDIEKGNHISVGIVKGHKDTRERLFLAFHHLIMDGVSWRILLSDLEAFYRGEVSREKTASYREWYHALEQYKVRAKEDFRYWQEVARLARQFQLPTGKIDNNNGSETIDITFSEEFTQKLLTQTQSVYNTQVNDLLLCAFILSIQNLTQHNTIVFSLEGHGREQRFVNNLIDLSRTVGWFTTLYPVVIHLSNPSLNADISELIKSVKEQLRDIPDKGLSYGVLRYLDQEGSKLNYKVEVSFNYLGDLSYIKDKEKHWHFSDEISGRNVALDNKTPLILNVNGLIINKKLRFEFTYSKSHFKREVIAAVKADFERGLNIIVDHILEQKKRIYTFSDYKLTMFTGNSKHIINLNEEACKKLILIHPGRSGAESYFEFCKKFNQQIGFYLFEHFERYTNKHFRTIEAIATFYIEHLLDEQIPEPYYLGGWSFGGLIAHEMGYQLTQMNKQVRGLYLIDPIVWTGETKNKRIIELQQELNENSLKRYSYSWIGQYREVSFEPKVYNTHMEFYLATRVNFADNQNDPAQFRLMEFYANHSDELNGFKGKVKNYIKHELDATHDEIILTYSQPIIQSMTMSLTSEDTLESQLDMV